ncbi:hypothetical protein DVH24_026282 [Malus domestica]|uniref:Uncharacterized protein n=1 Tax=Malus domestica TaxID=3750 RepID=A0A498KIA4_MALDO|nr:hypothetical protein DVH24_026282 [Malus domestica]
MGPTHKGLHPSSCIHSFLHSITLLSLSFTRSSLSLTLSTSSRFSLSFPSPSMCSLHRKPQHPSPPHSPFRQTLSPPKHHTPTLALSQLFSFSFLASSLKQRSTEVMTAAELLIFGKKLTRRIDKLCRGLTSRRDFPSNPVWVSLENTLVRFFKLFRDVLVNYLPDLVKVGCNFNLGDKFPRFLVRVMSFRLILGYHRPPNGPDKGIF